MASSLLQGIEAKERIEKVLEAINKAFPDQKPIQDELSKYSQSKDTFIKQLQEISNSEKCLFLRNLKSVR